MSNSMSTNMNGQQDNALSPPTYYPNPSPTLHTLKVNHQEETILTRQTRQTRKSSIYTN